MAQAMDEDAAELAALRRRAYGPQADIGGDPAAMARLGELEHRVGAGTPAAGATDDGPGVSPDAATDDPGRAEIRRNGENRSDPGGSVPSPPQHLIRERDAGASRIATPAAGSAGVQHARRAPAWHTAMVVAVAAVTVLIGGAAAAETSPSARPEASVSPAPPPDTSPAVGFEFAADPSSKILFRVPLSGVRGQLLDLPDPDSGPDFPTEQAIAWTQPLGEYFGWRLWIARDQDDDPCMLVTADRTFSRCVTAGEQRDGALFLSVPYDLMTEAERPAGMAPNQSIGFWWIPGDTVLILTGQTSDAAP